VLSVARRALIPQYLLVRDNKLSSPRPHGLSGEVSGGCCSARQLLTGNRQEPLRFCRLSQGQLFASAVGSRADLQQYPLFAFLMPLSLTPTPTADLLVAAARSVAADKELAGTPTQARTIGNAITRWAAARSGSPALIGADSQHITFSELVCSMASAAVQLANAGVQAEHRVGLLVPPGMLGGHLAVALASNVALVPLNPDLKPDEVVEFARASGLHAIVIPQWLEKTDARSAILEQEITAFEAVRAPDGTFELKLLTVPAGAPIALRPMQESDVALLLRSSGTTGAPKLIPVTHGNLVAMADKMGSSLWFGLTAEDRAACTAPLYYAAGLKPSLFVPLMLGAAVVFPPPNQVFELAEWVDALRPTYLTVAPGALQGMLHRMRASRREFRGTSLRFVLCGSSYLPEETRLAVQSMLRVPILEFYGLSEAGIMAANPVPPRKRKPGTVGLPAPGELLVVDENRQPIPTGSVGEIMISGPMLMPGYATTEGSSAGELKDRWLLTGDLGRIDEDGYLIIEGRLKEVINRGGEKVFPYEIEKALLEHPALLEAAAFGVPHPRLGESVAAAVVLKPGSTVGERELKEFLAARLTGYKLPRRLCYVSSLPRGSSGKISRTALSKTHAFSPRKFAPPAARSFLELELLDLWKRLLGTPDVGLDDDFFDRGGDSLLATEMLIELEALTGKPYPQAELSTLTIRRIAEVFASDIPAERDVMTQVKRGSGVPLFLCHGDYANRGIYAHKLAARLPDDRPMFLLQCYADRLFGSRVEEIARVYLKQVLSVAPPGSPVFIAGYCNGGLVAWHLAHLLRCAGVKVMELLLIETISLNARPALAALPAIFRAAGSLVPGPAGRFVREHGMRHVWYWARRFGDPGFRGLPEEIAGWLRRPPGQRDALAMADRTYFALMSRYVPPRIDAPVTCFIAEQGRHFETDPRFWRRLAPSVSSVSVPGTHQGIFVSGRQAVATRIVEVLGRATRRYLLRAGRPSVRDVSMQ
jgi:oxalate---CoA ligase